MQSHVLNTLRARREEIYAEARAVADTAASFNRNLSGGEQRRFDELTAEIDAIDARVKKLKNSEQRDIDAANVFARIGGQPQERRTLSEADKDLDAAFRSAILAKNPAPIEIPVSNRTHYQPGIERRDLLNTTATQSHAVSVYDRIVEHMVESSAVLRAGATVLNTRTGENIEVPKSTAFSTAGITAEAAAITESDPTLDVVTLGAFKYGTFFQVSHELANDNSVDLLGFLARQAGEALAQAYGNHLINGTGTGQPRGVLADATIGKTGPVGTATTLGAQGTAGQGTDLLYDLHGSLAEPYAAQPSRAWLMRNPSLTTVRKLKATDGQPVIGGDSFLGAPFLVDPFVPAMAASAESIIYGDWSRYFVRIAEGLRFERSNDFAFQNDLVSFKAVIRLDAALVDLSAIKTFQHSAT